MNDVLVIVLAEVAENMAFLTPLGPADAGPPPQALVLGVEISGPRGGRVILAAEPAVAAAIARNLLAADPEAPIADEDALEALKELANVVAGNLVPRLWGEAEWRLAPPIPVSWPAAASSAVHLALAEGAISLVLEN